MILKIKLVFVLSPGIDIVEEQSGLGQLEEKSEKTG